MTPENTTINQTPIPTPVVPTPPVAAPRPNKFKDIIAKARSFAYSNKKLLKILFITLGAFFVLVVMGIIYSLTKDRSFNTETIPTPQASAESIMPGVNETEVKLKALKERVIRLDVYQKHLAPPVLNFDISF